MPGMHTSVHPRPLARSLKLLGTCRESISWADQALKLLDCVYGDV